MKADKILGIKVNDFNLSLLEKQLVPATTAEDLDVFLDSNLNFNDYLDAIMAVKCMTRRALGYLSAQFIRRCD